MSGIVLAGVVALVAFAATDERQGAFTLPVGDTQPAARLRPGGTACQRPLTAQGDFHAVQLTVGSSGPVRLAIAVIAGGGSGGRPLAATDLAFPGGRSPVQVQFDRTVHKEERFALCVSNAGARAAAIYGSEARTKDLSSVTGDGARENSDLSLSFLRENPRSVLADVPEMFERAALFRPGFMGAWTFWLLLAGVALGVPALLSAALRSAVEPDA